MQHGAFNKSAGPNQRQMGRFSYQGPLTVAGVTLGTAPQGYAIKPAAGPAVPVTYQGQMILVQALGP